MDELNSAAAMLSISLSHLNGHAELIISGELDIATVELLRHALDDLIADGHRDLRLNLSGLTFLDATGVGALVTTRLDLKELGGSLSLHEVAGMPMRILGICDLLETFTTVTDSTASEPPQGKRFES
jgi:anti-sigma B factor antagonist